MMSQSSLEIPPRQDSLMSSSTRLDSAPAPRMDSLGLRGGNPLGLTHPLSGSASGAMPGFGAAGMPADEAWGARGTFPSSFS